MLGTVSPANIHVEETLATLRYACQARAIINRVRINEDPHERLIRELKAEVLRLRGVREGYEKQLGVFPRRLLDSIEPTPQTKDEIMQKQTEIDKLKDQLRKTEEQLVATQMTRLERLQKTEEKKNSELKYLRRCGIAIEIDFHEKDRQPCLVNLTADPMLSGTLLYLIPPGSVRIGKNCASRIPSRDPDIILDGPLVRQLHCTIENNNGKLILAPEMDGDTYVNGQVVTGKVFLKHGDRLVIGGNHYFKVSNPHDRHRGDIQISTQAVDFEYAHQEILRVQEEKLRTELEESKQKAIKELENAKHEIELQLGTQKISYERKIEILGSTLEEQKHALEKINQQKRKLELEKELLANEVETNNRRKQMQVQEDNVNITPYKSNFLQELENILSEKTADVEIALKMKASRDVMNAGGISLHELQLLVKEATERCREFAINYEFDQQQIVVEKSLQSVVRIRDRDRMMETLWEPLYFLDWLRRLRDYDIEDSIKELREWGGDWEPYENSEVFEDSLNTSRISINMTPVKRHLNESLHQLSMDMSTFGEMTVDYTLDISKQREDMNVCLIQMETAAKALRKLCERYESPGLDAITKYLNKVHNIIGNLKDTLDLNDIMQGESVCSVQSIDNTVIEKSDDASRASSVICNDKMSVVPKSDCSPTKSSFRNNNPQSTKNGGTPKIVRFTEKKEGDLT
ncbi:hypothetical protein KM043_018107 [Ampulex compressa]|nr:hypothetical protein KM043_018107 [Ampulex compressa]